MARSWKDKPYKDKMVQDGMVSNHALEITEAVSAGVDFVRCPSRS